MTADLQTNARLAALAIGLSNIGREQLLQGKASLVSRTPGD